MKKKIVGIVVLMLVCTTMVSATNINMKENSRMTIPSSDVVTKQEWFGYTPEQLSTNNVTWLGYYKYFGDTMSGTLYPPMFWAIRLTNEELAPYNGLKFVETAWYHHVENYSIPTHTYDAKIWIGNETRPITLLLNDTGLLANEEGWANHTLSAPVTIDASKDYWIVIKVYCHPSYDNDLPMLFDSRTVVEKKSMWCHNSNNHTETDFYQLTDVPGNWKGAWLLRIAVEIPIAVTIKKGGFGVSASVKNIGTTDITNISWTIALDGNMIFLGKIKSSVIPSIAVGKAVTIKDLIFGFGATGINVTAGPVRLNATGKAFLFFIFGVK